MNTNRVFELLAAHLWPGIRLFVKRSRRCGRCILSERASPLERGLCVECRRAGGSENKADGSSPADAGKRFDDLMAASVGDRRYDALLLLGGGKDSAYVLDRLRREHPDLKILCVAVNNGFMGPLALRNAQLTAGKTQTDLLISNAHIPEFARRFRRAFLDLNGRGGYGVIDYADGELVFDIGRRLARDLGIPLTIAGLTWVQLQRIFGIAGFESTQDGCRMVYPLAAWRTSETEISRTVRDGRLMLPGSDSPLVSNSQLILTLSVVDVLTLGYSSFEPEFAQLVREGKTDRQKWLRVFEMLEFAVRWGLLNGDAERSLAKLGLTLADVVKTDE